MVINLRIEALQSFRFLQSKRFFAKLLMCQIFFSLFSSIVLLTDLSICINIADAAWSGNAGDFKKVYDGLRLIAGWLNNPLVRLLLRTKPIDK